jgi:hypothetical protein
MPRYVFLGTFKGFVEIGGRKWEFTLKYGTGILGILLNTPVLPFKV